VSPGTVISEKGCYCTSGCFDTVGSTQQWCFTSEQGVDPPPANNIIVLLPTSGASSVSGKEAPCGFYSSTRRAYWDFACRNATESQAQLDTAVGLWSSMTTAGVVTMVLLYSVSGIVAAYRLVAHVKLPLLGLAALILWPAYGALAGFAVIGFLSVLLAQVYLAMPYALPFDVATALGIAAGAMLAYFHSGQHFFSLSAGIK
jgi:hypothetical protein